MDQGWSKPGDDRIRLKPGTVLGGEFIIDGELGAGGFGITYRGRDQRLSRVVAIKEYFPLDIGSRDSSMSIRPLTANQDKVFHWGLDKFIQEAQMLAAFKHPGIVSVLRYFEENLTAYMVLDFIEGKPMGKWLDVLGRTPTQAELDRITTEICDALQVIHRKEIVHRDIAPDNIIIRPNGSAVLLDFGAARQDLAVETRVRSRSLHSTSYAVVKHHYSPIEAHSTDRRNRGPWTDVYSLGATLYRAVAGTAPEDAMNRMGGGSNDPLSPAAVVGKGKFRRSFLEAVDQALMPARQSRLQSIADFRELAFRQDAPPPRQPEAPPIVSPRGDDRNKVSSLTEFDRWQPNPDARRPSPAASSRLPVIMAVCVALALSVALGLFMANRVNVNVVEPVPTPNPAPTPLPPKPGNRFADTRQQVESAIAQLRRSLDEGRRAGVERQWSRQRTMAGDAQRFVDEARNLAERLRGAATSESERRMVDDLRAEIEVLDRQVSDMRRGAVEAEDKDRRDQASKEEQQLRQLVDGALGRLRNSLEEGRRAGGEQSWIRQRIMALDAKRHAEEARRAAERWRGHVGNDNSRQQAADLITEIDRLDRQADDMRRRAEEEMARPPPPPVRTWTTYRNRWVQGDGYEETLVNDFNICGQRCVADARCVMFEWAIKDKGPNRGRRICNLYSDRRPLEPTPGDGTHMGIMDN